MAGTFWALVPPIVAIVLALITKETYSSLFVGILVGSLFVGGFHPVASLDVMVSDGSAGLSSMSTPARAPCSPPSCWAC